MTYYLLTMTRHLRCFLQYDNHLINSAAAAAAVFASVGAVAGKLAAAKINGRAMIFILFPTVRSHLRQFILGYES